MSDEEKKPRVMTPTMSRDYMFQMTSMMVMANLYNSSSGRDPGHAAKTACQAAKALCDEWEKQR